MTHALGTLYLSTNIVLNDTPWTVYNSSAQNQMIAFSLGYFLYDTVYTCLLEWNNLFLIHHTAVGTYWVMCLQSNTGGYAGAIMMLMGECSNPIQLPWELSRRMKYTSISNFLSPIFTYSFITMRCGVLPIVSPYLWYRMYLLPEPNENYKLAWMGLGTGVIIASMMWSKSLWKGYKKYKN
jgi:hypothetical protein